MLVYIYMNNKTVELSTTSGDQMQFTSDHTNAESSKNCMCILCGKNDSQKSQYGARGESECTYLVQHYGSVPPDSSIICNKHLLEAKRYCHILDHTPSWKKQVQKALITTTKCSNPKCKTVQGEKSIKPMFAPMDKLCEILGTKPTV